MADASLYANSVSDNRYVDKWYVQGELPTQIEVQMFDDAIGTTVEPYMYNNAYHTARLLGRAKRPSEMKASHILIAYSGALRAASGVTRTKEQAQSLADSLYKVVRKNTGKIEDLAIEFSNDGAVTENKGHYDWFADGQMVPAFNEAVVEGKKGEVVMVETPFGFHVIRIDDKRNMVEKVKVAMIDRAIEPSNQTYQDVYVKANEFASKSTSFESFKATAEEMNISPRVGDHLSPMQSEIPGLADSRQIIMWAYNENTSLHDINLFDSGNQYVVAVLSKINPEGYQTLDEVKSTIAGAVLNRKKAEMMIEKIDASANKNDVNKLAAELGLKVENLPNLTFDSRGFSNYGPEPDVIGAAFALKQGDVSAPVMGKKAVFVLALKSLKEAEVKDNYQVLQQQMLNRFNAQVNFSLYRTLEEKADIEDNRYKFF